MKSSSYGSDEGLRNGDVAELCEVFIFRASQFFLSSVIRIPYTLYKGLPLNFACPPDISIEDIQSTTLGS